MPDELDHLLAGNRAWAERVAREDPGFFPGLAAQQNPEYLWIGCSDSRVPSSQILDVQPGDVFVHRNVANVIHHADLNCLSVVEFAVTVLKVRHVIVCGHFGCSGVQAALRGECLGILDHWLRSVRDLYEAHREELDALGEEAAWARACELNVLHQVRNVCRLDVIRDAWSDGQDLTVHGWIYSVADGLLRDLGSSVDATSELPGPALS